MYFPIGLPQEYRFPKSSSLPEEPIGICSNRDRSLILLLTTDTLHIWFCKPCVQITALQRSAHSIEERGRNVQAVWKSDATTILVTTDKGRLLFYKLEVDGADNQSLYLKKGYSRKQHKSYDAVFLGEGIPALTLRELHSFNLNENITSVSALRDELLVTTREGSLKRIKWDCTLNAANSTCLTDIQFSYDLQQSRGRHLKNTNEHVVDVEYSPLLGGFVAVLSGGRGFFLSAPHARFDLQNLHGVWAPELRDATCVHANHKYRLIVFGCQSGKGIAYHIDPATGALQLSHELTVSTKQYPDAGIVGGAISRLAWTPDECAIIAAWRKGGIAVWSVFGALLFCSLKATYGLPSPSQNSFIVKAMEWGAEGYQLWLSAENGEQSSPSDLTTLTLDEHLQTPTQNGESSPRSPSSSPEPESITRALNQQLQRQQFRIRGKYDFLQIYFVKSPLAVNPCLSNHKHLFLQSEDKLYVNLGSDKNQEDEASNILIANKQWRVIPIRYAYLGSNWPIRYSAMDDSGLSIAIAGRTGLAHYSLLRRRWILFGNEAQEKNMVVCGGLIWWRDFICVGCFDMITGKDQIRFYPSTQKLDNGFSTTTIVPSSILLINTFQDYLICLCADRHIMIFAIQVRDIQAMPQLDLRRIQDVSVNGFIPHPMCVTFITLSTLNAETSQSNKDSGVNKYDIPESILMNVAGHLLMFQRDWSGPQPKQSTNRYRPVPFCNPMKVASSVENIWVPEVDSQERKELVESLWLSSGASGMKVWLTLSTQSSVQTQSFMSKRIMLPFAVDIYPLAVFAEDAVILGAASDHSTNEVVSITPGTSVVTQGLDFSTLERTSEIYLHQVLRQLLRRNLGFHALQLARCFTTLPYFSHILELLLHEVLEEEATSKEPIPDPLLPRVVMFSKEFPQYRKTVAHCARKTEIALWEHLFSTVGSPKALFEECLVHGDLDTASSYLIILQNLEKFYVSRQHATLLLESALETRSWPLARDVVRFLKRIDPHEAEIEPVIRPLPSRYGQRFTAPALDLEDELDKPPLVRNPSLSFYEADNRMMEKSSKAEGGGQPLSRKHSVPSQKSEEPEKHDVEVLLYRHARKLLATYRIRDLGLFAANLEEYELVGFLRKERTRGARVEDAVQAIKQLHTDFSWPLPILTHSAFYKSLRTYSALPSKLPKSSTRREDINDGDLGGSQSTKDIVLSPIAFNLGGETSTPEPSEETDVSDVASINNDSVYSQQLNFATAGDLSRSNSESQLHDISMELANRGPTQSESELRYLFQVMVEAECFDWCLLFSLVLRDSPLFVRTISLAASLAEKDAAHICKLSSDLIMLKHWVAEDCLGYKPFLGKMGQEIEDLNSLCKRLVPDSRSRHSSRLSSISSESNSEQDEGPVASSPAIDKTADSSDMHQSESCVIS